MPSRRQILAGSGAALATAVSVGSGEADRPSVSTYDWPMERYDPAGTGFNPSASGPKDGVRVKWQRELDDHLGGGSSPILVDGMLYTTGYGLLALDMATGETRFVVEGSYQSSPALAEATAYTTDTLAVTSPWGVYGLNADGGIRLLGHQFGTERWHGPDHEPDHSFFGPPMAVPPVTVGSTIYATLPGDGDVGYVVALDANDGRERWRQSPGDELRRPAARNGVVFTVNWPSTANAYDADSGERLWHRELDEQMVLAPTATNEGVVVPDRTGVTLLDARDGSIEWRFEHGGNATEGAAAVARGRVFVASGDSEGSVYAIDLERGEEVWATPLPGEGTPVVADGVVYIATATYSELVALDAASGEVRWRYESRASVSTPAVGDGVLYAVGYDRIFALEER